MFWFFFWMLSQKPLSYSPSCPQTSCIAELSAGDRCLPSAAGDRERGRTGRAHTPAAAEAGEVPLTRQAITRCRCCSGAPSRRAGLSRAQRHGLSPALGLPVPAEVAAQQRRRQLVPAGSAAPRAALQARAAHSMSGGRGLLPCHSGGRTRRRLLRGGGGGGGSGLGGQGRGGSGTDQGKAAWRARPGGWRGGASCGRGAPEGIGVAAPASSCLRLTGPSGGRAAPARPHGHGAGFEASHRRPAASPGGHRAPLPLCQG